MQEGPEAAVGAAGVEVLMRAWTVASMVEVGVGVGVVEVEEGIRAHQTMPWWPVRAICSLAVRGLVCGVRRTRRCGNVRHGGSSQRVRRRGTW